ncbi:GUN4 domain-containing protein [Nostoc sp. LPT]|uniref:GUN4 domain-containing protein n=1 Tax=Nostoc sp. LPT TaxID=2815387 RepID=UPI001D8A1184|nr:GUN4 domain-containing protein [Nostoc sp. LPT]MBN4001487.1 GUN4 domain-containing protein [Nostoc sp. LPT]
MAEDSKDQNAHLTLEGFWKILDSKLVSLGTPAALIAVAVDFARKSQWKEAGLCVVGAFALWLLIQVANKLAPRIDKLLDWMLNNVERISLDLYAKLTSDFEGKYYERLKFDCREYEIRGINRGTLRLENLFVPLKMAQTSAQKVSHNIIQYRQAFDPLKQQEIGNILVLMTGDIKQRLVILGAPGSGKSTLLRHITLLYATRKQRRLHRKIPKLIPILLQLRNVYQDIIQEPQPPLALVIENAVKKLQSSQPLEPRQGWFAKRLRQNKCLVMLDGLDEIADDTQRQQVSQWVSQQINEYPNTPFILTSRPEGYKKAPLQGNFLELEVQPFTREQRNKFIQDWYKFRKKEGNNNKEDLGVRDSAIKSAKNLIAQIDTSPSLKMMAKNPLLLNMIAITHGSEVTLSTKRVDLYKDICRVLLEGRQRAKGLSTSSTSLSADQKQVVLKSLALELMQKNTQAFTLDETSTYEKTFKEAKSLIQEKLDRFPNQTLSPEDFIKKDDLGVRELLTEREQEGIYEFAHKTFQEYLAAVEIEKTKQENILLEALADDKKFVWWRETIRFYVAQTDATHLIQVALNHPTIPVLTLVYQCWQGKEAQQIEREVQQQLRAKLEQGLESDKLDEFTLAAEVKLAYRLSQLNQDLQTLDSYSEQESQAYDSSYITCAEYQLFLNETSSPRILANKKRASEPVINISFWDANRFCAWLSLRSRKQLGEPGICYRKIIQTDRQQHPCEEDKEYADKQGIRLVRFQVPTLYGQLAYYLAAGMWEEADKETDRLMLQVAGREKQGYLDLGDIRQFPCEDLRTIDQLWVQYSNGHFGFSVQKEIYLSVGGILEGNQANSPFNKLLFLPPVRWIYARFGGRVMDNNTKNYEAYIRFSDRVGWKVGQTFWQQVKFDISASKGHLPQKYDFVPTRSKWWYLYLIFSRVQTCKL